jgi:hypothetical protein
MWKHFKLSHMHLCTENSCQELEVVKAYNTHSHSPHKCALHVLSERLSASFRIELELASSEGASRDSLHCHLGHM